MARSWNRSFLVYDLKDNELCLGEFNDLDEICKQFSLTKSGFFRVIQSGGVSRHRYKFVEVKG